MTLVHPGGPSPAYSLGGSPGTSPGTSPGGSSAASTGHFGNRLLPIFTREDIEPRPRLQIRAFGLEIDIYYVF
jgi:hypothetical protein